MAEGGSLTIADLYNVVHFKLDEESQASVQKSIDDFCSKSDNLIEFAVGVAEGAAEQINEFVEGIKEGIAEESGIEINAAVEDNSESKVVGDVDGIVEKASEQAEVPVKPEVDQESKEAVISEFSSLKSTLTKILGVFGIAFGFSQFRDLTEEFNGINDSINYATQGLDNQREIQQEILQAANDCKASYGDLAGYAVQLKTQNEDIFPIEDATQFAKLVNQVEQNAGKGDSVATVQHLMSTIFATGELTETTLTRLGKTAPEVVNTIAKGLGVSTDKLRDMAGAGQISAQTIKDAYFNAADDIQASFDELDYSISDALTAARNKWGYKLDEVNVKFGITEKIAKGIVRVSELIEKGFDTAVNVFEKLADAVGDVDNLITLLAGTLGSLFLAWKGNTIISGLKSITSLFTVANAKAALMAAGFLLIFLVAQDLFTFLQGGDSVIGELLEGAGADVDGIRTAILGFFDDVKQFGAEAIQAISGWWAEHGDEVQAVMQGIGNYIQMIFNNAYDVVSGFVDFFTALFDGDITGAAEALQGIFSDVLDNINQFFIDTFGIDILGTISGFVDSAIEVIDGFVGWVSDTLGAIGDFFGGIGDAVSGFISGGTVKVGNSALDNAVTANSQTSNNTNTVNQTVNNTFNVTDRTAATAASGVVKKSSKDAADALATEISHSGR